MRATCTWTWLALLAASACGANETPLPGADGGPTELQCLPDLDGVLRADEVPVVAGLAAEYYVERDVAVDLEGTVDERGVRVWSMANSAGVDRRSFEVARAADRWYAAAFPGDAFAAAVDEDGALETIYTVDERGIWGWGVASAAPNPPAGTTLLPYEEPVAVLRFPLRHGDAWTSVGAITGGELEGLPYNGVDTYEVEVDGSGRLEVPHLAFTQAHRVLTHVEIAPAASGATRSQRQVSFWFECFGEVARATSRVDETAPLFDSAASLRRLAL